MFGLRKADRLCIGIAVRRREMAHREDKSLLIVSNSWPSQASVTRMPAEVRSYNIHRKVTNLVIRMT